MSICPLAYLENHTAELPRIFCPRCLWPRLGHPLCAVLPVLRTTSCLIITGPAVAACRYRSGVIETARSAHLSEDARMSVEVVLVEYRVVVGERLGEAGQTSGRDLLERRLVRLVADAADVDRHSVVGVIHRRQPRTCRTYTCTCTHSKRARTAPPPQY